jgi:hypothetical protein
MRIPLLMLGLAACGRSPAEEWRARYPITYSISGDPWPEGDTYLAQVADTLNKRLGCPAIKLSHEGEGFPWEWVSWPALQRNAVSGVVAARLLVATTELPPELSTSGLLSPCEAGYLLLFWTAIRAGLTAQYEDPYSITYGHPNCPGYLSDPVEALATELHQEGIDLCTR